MKLGIRPATGADLEVLVAALGQRRFFSDRLARQRGGGGVLLVAWVDGRPVGDVVLDSEPATEPAIRRRLPGVPTLSHLEGLGPFQRRGIGTALIREGENTARQLGHRRLAIGVGVDNPSARRLYERLGYRDWGHGTVETSWQEHDQAGQPRTVSETIHMFVRAL
ncbi:MAG TPA: GNAT family N-acetyltransferase [Actinomycetes bacterium]|nr:GNAT family N-acetyltransferase [Actinomycetes bacterium]